MFDKQRGCGLSGVVTLHRSVACLFAVKSLCGGAGLPCFDREPCTEQDRWSKQLLPPVFLLKHKTQKNLTVKNWAMTLTRNRPGFSHGSCLRPRYRRPLDCPVLAFGSNRIYAEDRRIRRHVVLINAPFLPLSAGSLGGVGCVPSCLVGSGSSSLLKAACFLLLSRQPAAWTAAHWRRAKFC